MYLVLVVSLCLHGSNINVVVVVNHVHLPHDTGHVADLGLHVVLLLGQLLNKPVSEVEVVSGGPLVAHVVENVLEVAVFKPEGPQIEGQWLPHFLYNIG